MVKRQYMEDEPSNTGKGNQIITFAVTHVIVIQHRQFSLDSIRLHPQ